MSGVAVGYELRSVFLVRFRDGAVEVPATVAAEWLLGELVPDLLALSAEGSHRWRDVSGGVAALRGEHGRAMSFQDYVLAPPYVSVWLARARAALLADAEDASLILTRRGQAVRFIALHGSVAGMLEARFATLVDVVAALRDLPGIGLIVTDAYRAAVAAICRAILVAQMTEDRHVVPARLRETYANAADLLAARSGLTAAPAE